MLEILTFIHVWKGSFLTGKIWSWKCQHLDMKMHLIFFLVLFFKGFNYSQIGERFWFKSSWNRLFRHNIRRWQEFDIWPGCWQTCLLFAKDIVRSLTSTNDECWQADILDKHPSDGWDTHYEALLCV